MIAFTIVLLPSTNTIPWQRKYVIEFRMLVIEKLLVSMVLLQAICLPDYHNQAAQDFYDIREMFQAGAKTSAGQTL